MQTEHVDAFIDELLKQPGTVMQLVHTRLSVTDYELVLKKADPLKKYHGSFSRVTDGVRAFPMSTGERMSTSHLTICEVND